MSTDPASPRVAIDEADPAVVLEPPRDATTSSNAGPSRDEEPSRWSTAEPWVLPTIVACLVALFFFNGVFGQFVLDDPSSITDNPKIKNLADLPSIAFNPRRFVVYFSFAVNYALAGHHPGPYHVVNILIHVAAAVVLYDLVRISLRTPRLAPRFGREAPALAAAVALLWGVHPLQTQSVTYVVQRTESLMGLFFLLTLWLTARGSLHSSPDSLKLYAVAAVSCWLGAFTKEVMVVCPVVLLLFDLTILSNDWREAFVRRGALHFACFLSALVLTLNSAETFDEKSYAMGFGSTLISSKDFAKTQPEVILHYLKLTFWPQDLCIDYRWPVEQDGFVIAVSSFALGALFGASLAALWYHPPLGFVGLWFFLTLAPSSSVIPIIDLAFEHRMYLALATPATLVVLLGWAAWNSLADRAWPWLEPFRKALPFWVVTLAVLALGVRTFLRNCDYYTAEALWRDVVRQRPENPRAFHNLAVELENADKDAEAVPAYEKAIALGNRSTGHPLYKYHFNFGISLRKLKRWDEAAREFGEAAKLSREPYAEAYSNRAFALVEAGRKTEAVADFKQAVKIKPTLAYARAKLVELLVETGDYAGALEHAAIALQDEPNNVAVRLARARAWCGSGDYAKALAEYDAVVKNAPIDRLAKAELAWLVAACPDPENRFPARAERVAREVLDAPKTSPEGTAEVLARDALAAALAAQGKFDDARAVAEEAAKRAGELGNDDWSLRLEDRADRYSKREAFTFTPTAKDHLGR